jgi:Mrp family chromosome partitioning ATPase
MDKTNEKRIVKSTKSIVVNPEKSKFIDRRVIKKQFYNSFKYSMIYEDRDPVNLTIGVTSPNRGAGKTLTASNLAVSFALGYKKKTVLVDLSMHNPELHNIFGTDLKPGLTESFHNGSVYLSRTKLEKLYLLPAGKRMHSTFDMDNMVAIRDIINSLKQEFEVVILDMNSILPVKDFPTMFANQVDGLLVVVDTRQTKYEDVEKMFRHIKKDQTIGFVLNRIDED